MLYSLTPAQHLGVEKQGAVSWQRGEGRRGSGRKEDQAAVMIGATVAVEHFEELVSSKYKDVTRGFQEEFMVSLCGASN